MWTMYLCSKSKAESSSQQREEIVFFGDPHVREPLKGKKGRDIDSSIKEKAIQDEDPAEDQADVAALVCH